MFAEQTLLVQDNSSGSRARLLSRKNTLIGLICVLVLFSLTALGVNYFIYQYQGISYFPADLVLVGLNFSLIYAGVLILREQGEKIREMLKEIIYYFIIMGLVVLVSYTVQFTPFPPIDQYIVQVDYLLTIDTKAILPWIHDKPLFNSLLRWAYGSLSYQLCFIPLMVILAGRKELIREYYFLVITTVLIGFIIYYFFPTTAPASIINSDYFSEEQRATGLKFFQIHHHMQPTTEEGGMIAFPSFHLIWAWLCLYLVRAWPVAFVVLLPVNVLLTASCVLLGWHYFADLLGSVLVILFAHFLYRFMRAQEEPRGVANYPTRLSTWIHGW